MKLLFDIIPYTLNFKIPAKTSRNTFENRQVYFIKLYDQDEYGKYGIGECAPLQFLSIDDLPDYTDQLQNCLSEFSLSGHIEESWVHLYPSIAFGIETALNDLKNGGKRLVFSDSLKENRFPIKINGLVWMSEAQKMLAEAQKLVDLGYDCIKFKVGALDFNEECRILELFRKNNSSNKVSIRLDANGAFHPLEASEQLKDLKRFDIHSIEQPIKAGLNDDLARLSRQNILPIALDESLIGIPIGNERTNLLKEIRPAYIVLKPSLHGGFSSCEEWIDKSIEHHIGYWITSALESNIGLNAIAQFASIYKGNLHQGLGTGSLYENNVMSPLSINLGYLSISRELTWDLSIFE